MLTSVVLLVILAHGPSKAQLLGPWTQPETPTFPSAKYTTQVIGFDSDSETIWLIGLCPFYLLFDLQNRQ